MKSLWSENWSDFKSPLRVVVQFLLRSRETKVNKCRELKRKLDETQRLLARREAELERQREEIRELKRRTQRLETEKRIQAQATSPLLPDDPPIGTHGYGARMVSLAMNLARTVGLRGAQQSLEIIFDWLGVQQKVPHFTTIRNWVQRVGVAILKEPIERADDWVWMADHSNQIGPEKALVVLGVRASQIAERPLTPPGKVTLIAVSADEPSGKPVTQCEKSIVCLTLHRGVKDDRLLQQQGAVGFRRARIPDLCQEALSQGGLLTAEDLAHRVFRLSANHYS